MKTLSQHLTQYASYHRDRRNIATHYIGIPMIVVAVAVLMARLSLFTFNGFTVTLAHVAVLISALYYLKLDLRFGWVMSAFLAFSLAVATWAAALPLAAWLGLGLGLFVVGWVFQFIGHYFEGKKPAFVDDLMGLMIGPLFVAAELAFDMGLRKPLQHEIEAVVGPTRINSALQKTA
jgi:uncharacterized membrane protein YGL010W